MQLFFISPNVRPEIARVCLYVAHVSPALLLFSSRSSAMDSTLDQIRIRLIRSADFSLMSLASPTTKVDEGMTSALMAKQRVEMLICIHVNRESCISKPANIMRADEEPEQLICDLVVSHLSQITVRVGR